MYPFERAAYILLWIHFHFLLYKTFIQVIILCTFFHNTWIKGSYGLNEGLSIRWKKLLFFTDLSKGSKKNKRILHFKFQQQWLVTIISVLSYVCMNVEEYTQIIDKAGMMMEVVLVWYTIVGLELLCQIIFRLVLNFYFGLWNCSSNKMVNMQNCSSFLGSGFVQVCLHEGETCKKVIISFERQVDRSEALKHWNQYLREQKEKSLRRHHNEYNDSLLRR